MNPVRFRNAVETDEFAIAAGIAERAIARQEGYDLFSTSYALGCRPNYLDRFASLPPAPLPGMPGAAPVYRVYETVFAGEATCSFLSPQGVAETPGTCFDAANRISQVSPYRLTPCSTLRPGADGMCLARPFQISTSQPAPPAPPAPPAQPAQPTTSQPAQPTASQPVQPAQPTAAQPVDTAEVAAREAAIARDRAVNWLPIPLERNQDSFVDAIGYGIAYNNSYETLPVEYLVNMATVDDVTTIGYNRDMMW